MGGTHWLMLKDQKEKERALAFLKLLKGLLGLTVRIGDHTLETGVRIESTVHGCRTGIGLDYPLHSCCSTTADFVAREIARRFSVIRIGADSVGWYKDKDWEEAGPESCREQYGAYTDWASWQKDFKPEGSFEVRIFSGDLALIRGIEEQVVEKFHDLDRAAEALSV